LGRHLHHLADLAKKTDVKLPLLFLEHVSLDTKVANLEIINALTAERVA
jgi:hypothetical protein